MIIDTGYFFGEINIAQLGQPEVQENVNFFIKKYEKRFLLNYFGIELMNEINTENLSPTDPEIAKILNGAFFSYSDKAYDWVGLKNIDKFSPIANYVFYYFAKDMITSQEGVGEVFGKAENAVMASPDDRCVKAWNDMIEMLEPLDLLIRSYSKRVGANFSVINSFNL